MNNNKLHFVPQVVIDIAENIANTKHDNIKINYIARLEAIRDYCDAVLKKDHMQKSTNVWNPANYKRKV